MDSIIIDIEIDNSDIIKNSIKKIHSIFQYSLRGSEVVYDSEKTEMNEFFIPSRFDQLTFTLDKGEIWIQISENNSLYRICFYHIDYTNFNEIESLLVNDFKNSIRFVYLHEGIDELLSNSEVLFQWKRNKRLLPSFIDVIPNPSYTNRLEMEIIILESLPGHSHQMNHYANSDKLWFGACWQMYFSPIYYKYIPKPLWDEFTDCYEHKVFENGLRKITLFENPEDYDLSESRAKQWAFRRQLGIDSIAHEVCPRLNRQQFEPENLPVVITKKNCQKGQTRVTRFLDANKKLINSNKATYKEVKEYLDDGITIVFEEITELKKGFFRNLFARE